MRMFFQVGHDYWVRVNHLNPTEFKGTCIDKEGIHIWFKELGKNNEPFVISKSFILDYQEI